MKAILINPQTRTISEVEYNGDFHHIYALIDATCFDCVRIDSKETIYVDDEGLINGKANTVGLFYFKGGYPVVLAGKGLILSTDDDGDAIATAFTVEQIKERVDWVNAIMGGRIIGDKGIYNIPG